MKTAGAAPVYDGGMRTTPSSSRPRVLIIGAGFGGLEAAKALAGQPVEVTLETFGQKLVGVHRERLGLHAAVGGDIDPAEVVLAAAPDIERADQAPAKR